MSLITLKKEGDLFRIIEGHVPENVDNVVRVYVPEPGGIPPGISPDSWQLMKLQESTGFVEELSDPAEDIWNDI